MPAKFLDILPDPDFLITDAGFENVAGTAGQGFASVSLKQTNPMEMDRTISGLNTVMRYNSYPLWDITLAYNPLTKAQFDPIHSFLMQKKGGRLPFYVSLPQYKAPKDSTFATFVDSSSGFISAASNISAGSTSMEITCSAWAGGPPYTTGLPTFGDVFYINDPEDTLHTKAYMITHIETEEVYNTVPGSGNIRIHFSPGLQKYTRSGSEIIFNLPIIRVVQIQPITEYALGNDGLYAYNLRLMEALY